MMRRRRSNADSKLPMHASMMTSAGREIEHAEVCFLLESFNTTGVVQICAAGGKARGLQESNVAVAKQCVARCSGIQSFLLISPDKSQVSSSASQVS
jgi:hypothetical protein